MKVSDCNKNYGEQLSAYADGMLEGDNLRRISQHLEHCESCRAECASLVQVRSLLRQMSTPSSPPAGEFWTNAYRTARLSAPESAGHRPFAERHGLARLAGIVGFAAVVGAGIVSIDLPVGHIGSTHSTSAGSTSVVDVSDLVRAHANFAASQPLTDRARVTMVTSEIASQSSDGVSVSADSPNADQTEPGLNAAIGMD